ncbi:MAG: hypothetical protein GY708_26195 [Actinomycetia bacterium]|nr:hypothetical protein [Actinomycetes bacterium]
MAERRQNVPKPDREPAGRPEGWEPPGKAVAAEATDDEFQGRDKAEEILATRPEPPKAWSGERTANGPQNKVEFPNGLVLELPDAAAGRQSVTVSGRSAPDDLAKKLSDAGVLFELDVTQVGGSLPTADDARLAEGEKGHVVDTNDDAPIERGEVVTEEPD